MMLRPILIAVFSTAWFAASLHAQESSSKAARVVSVPAAGGGEATPVEVAFSVDKANFKSGEIPVIKVTAARNCRLSLFYEDAGGKLTQLFPNQFIANDQVKGGKEFQLLPAPNPQKPGDQVAIEIFGPPFGKESFIVIATVEAQGILAAANTKGAGGSPFPDAIPKAARVVSQVIAPIEAVATATTSGPLKASGTGTARITVNTSAN